MSFLERLDAIDNTPQSAAALAQLAGMPKGSANARRKYLHGDHPMLLYAAVELNATGVLLSIRHHRELSFDFARTRRGQLEAGTATGT